MSEAFSKGDPEGAILSGDDLAASLVAQLGPTLTEGPAEADTPAQPRTPTGQFASQESDDGAVTSSDSQEAESSEAPVQDTAEEDDGSGDIEIELTPELEDYLAKYDGDLGKALRASAEAQSLIGRQGEELGNARRELEALRQTQQQPQQVQQNWMPYRSDIDENPQGLVMEALERGDANTFTQAIRAWASLGPEESFEATMFMNQFQRYENEMEPLANQGTPQSTTLDAEMKGVLDRHPDAKEYVDDVVTLQQSFPTLQEELHYGDPAQQARAYEQLLVIAKGRATTPETQKATRRLIVKTQEEVRKAKEDADVVSASNRTAAQADEDSDPVQDALAAIFPTPQDLVTMRKTEDGRTVRTIG